MVREEEESVEGTELDDWLLLLLLSLLSLLFQEMLFK
jgi:hypothetical protein